MCRGLIVICVTGMMADCHPGRLMNQVQFEIYLRSDEPISDDQYIIGAMGLQKARVVEWGGGQHVQGYVICLELQHISSKF